MAITLNGTTGITNDGGYTGDGVSFADTTPSNTLVTTTGGNVGIGTSSPSYKLDVLTTDGTVGVASKAASGAIALIPYLDSTNGAKLAAYNNAISAFSHLTVDGTYLRFNTSNNERMRIDSSGNLLVGTTGTIDSTYNFNLYFSTSNAAITRPNSNRNYNAYSFRNSSNTEVGYIFCTNTATSYGTSSDYRLKENVQPMTGALAKVQALKPCTYTWKVDGSSGQGFIAHELQAVVPDCVTGEKDAVDAEGNPVYQGIDTSFLVATLTAAIQEQQAIITDLKARIEILENK